MTYLRLSENVLFAADVFDAHDFLDQARQKNCAGVIAQKVPEGWFLGMS